MNRKHEHAELGTDNSEYTVHRSRLSLVVAAALCLLLSVIVWLFVMNVEDTAYVSLELKGGAECCVYVLSDTQLEVRGTVLFLKKADVIEVIVPDTMCEPGTYSLSLENLVLPEGVSLTEIPNLTLTVEGK